jgi:hypothetical protein
MKIEIELKPASARRLGAVAATLIVLGLVAVVHANQTKFSSGQALTAAQLNHNFDEVYAAAAKPAISRDGKAISIGGAYCGKTAGAPYDGSAVGGYSGGKAQCEDVCLSPTAHMCDAAEIVRSRQLGVALPDGAWVAAFTSTTTDVNCLSWTNNQNNNFGMVTSLAPPILFQVQCSTSHAIACCD